MGSEYTIFISFGLSAGAVAIVFRHDFTSIGLFPKAVAVVFCHESNSFDFSNLL